MQVSVIIPVYNCETYLKQCLDSVRLQTLQGLEIICIDDGSSDKSYDILMQYAEKDTRIMVLRQDNQGAGAARNYGIRMAKGKYLAFLDADDYYIDCDALEKMYQLCEREHLQVCGSLRRYLERGELKKNPLFSGDELIASQGLMVTYDRVQNDYHFHSYLFRRSLLTQNNIFFPPYRWFEDPVLLVKALYAAGHFMVADTCLYCYRCSSILSKIDTDKVLDLLRGIYENLDFASQHKLEDLFNRTRKRLEYEYFGTICRFVSQEEKECIQILQDINKLIKCELGNPDYQIRPLQFILNQEGGSWDSYEDYLCAGLREEEELYLYGAGLYAGKFISYLREHGYFHKVSGIFVSKLDEQQWIEGIEVKEFNRDNVRDDIRIYVVIGWTYQEEIAQILEANGISKYILVDSTFLSSL